MSLILHTWGTPNGRKISIMLEELGLPYTVHPIDINHDEQFAAAFLSISPNNKIPALVDTDAAGGSLAVFESGAILTYLAEKTGRLLAPSGAARYAALEWLHWSIGGLGPMVGQLNFFSKAAPQAASLAIARYTREVSRLLGVLERRLAEAVYLGGTDYSIADIAAYTWASFVSTQLRPMVAASLESKPAMAAWLDRIGERAAVQRGMQIPPDSTVMLATAIADLKQRIKVTEEECAALRVPDHEEDYMQACSMVDALELQLEQRLREATV